MFGPLNLIFSVIAVFIIGITLAFTVKRQRFAGTYRQLSLPIVSLLWILATFASFHAICSPIGCSYGLNFSWPSQLLPGISPQAARKLAVVSMFIYFVLCAYFIGHALGALIWWLGSKFRRV
ncbi:hypothetical protein CYK37_27055 [Mesorhizobium loti]|nr:hypothetical protein [Mesorhizobium loti]PLP56182.1 hypothetical protein CYK37_27055 [Mesorhizobium loti]